MCVYKSILSAVQKNNLFIEGLKVVGIAIETPCVVFFARRAVECFLFTSKI